MKKRLFSLILSLFIVTSGVLPTNFSSPSVSQAREMNKINLIGNYEKGSVIVTLVSPKDTTLAKDGTEILDNQAEVEDSWDFGSAEFLANDANMEMFLSDKEYYVSYIKSDTYSTEELMAQLSHRAYVTSVTPNYYYQAESISNDTYVDNQWHQSGAASVHAESLWSKQSSETPIVAVVDTGIDYTHEDLQSNMWTNPYQSKGLPGTYGYDYGDSDSNPMDESGHGTHCAGIIAAGVNNQTGTAGISNRAKLMALKIFNSQDSTSIASIISAFEYIYQAQLFGANIAAVNCSWGGGSQSSYTIQLMTDLVNKIGQNGALFSFAAGNDGTEVTSQSGTPYNINSDYTISVGSSNSQMQANTFSCYSKTLVDLFAPGDMILSTVPTDTYLPEIYNTKKQEELTTYYDTAKDDNQLSNYKVANVYIKGNTASTFEDDTITFSSNQDSDISIGKNSSGGCYVWDATLYSGQNLNYFLYDVTDMNLDPSECYYISLMFGSKNGTQIDWQHENFVSTESSANNRFVQIGERTYMKIIGMQGPNQTKSTFYLDNIAISVANPNTASFGKYDYYSGTSMAAPVVSGALALLAQTYPSDTITARKSRLLTSVTKTSAFSSKCVTGGTLYLSNASKYTAPLPQKISMTASASSVAVKKSIQLKSSISPTDAEQSVSYQVSNAKYATINANGKLTAKTKGAGKTVTVTAISKANTALKASLKIKIKKQKVTKVKLNRKKITLKVGKKKKLKATATPSYANNKKVKWYSSNKKYASVTKKGVVKALRKGAGKTVRIYAKAKDGSKKKASCKVKIKA